MFHKETREVALDGGENPPKRMTVTYKGEPCSSVGSRKQQYDLLLTVVNTPGLLDCGLQSFQSLKMLHDGDCWVLILEAQT